MKRVAILFGIETQSAVNSKLMVYITCVAMTLQRQQQDMHKHSS